jgi:hypothetical protein
MSYDIFISYSNKDKNVADAVCVKLESVGIKCWMAPRDIQPGANWGEAIIDAITECRALVFIFSNHSVANLHQRGSSNGTPEPLVLVDENRKVITFTTSIGPGYSRQSKVVTLHKGEACFIKIYPRENNAAPYKLASGFEGLPQFNADGSEPVDAAAFARQLCEHYSGSISPRQVVNLCRSCHHEPVLIERFDIPRTIYQSEWMGQQTDQKLIDRVNRAHLNQEVTTNVPMSIKGGREHAMAIIEYLRELPSSDLDPPSY